MVSLSDRQKFKYDWFKERERQLTAQAESNAGRLRRHEWWRLSYYRHPYLMLETDDGIRNRFIDVFANTVDLSREGKIIPQPMMANEGRFAQVFTELIEETNARGILTREVVNEAVAPIRSYFSDGEPLGLRMFGDREHLPGQWLVKYSKRSHVEDMLKFGRFRIAPASEYAKASHIKAMTDLETARDFKLKAIKEALEGTESFVFQNIEIKIQNGVVPLQCLLDDYYLFSTCKEIDRRMPTDFEADAALVIKDRGLFISKLRQAMLKIFPDLEFLEGEVYYFDPYNDVPKTAGLEFWKPFSFAYQKEHRCVLRRRQRWAGGTKLAPFFVELGPLDAFAELVTAK
jgi:hypothetical protein